MTVAQGRRVGHHTLIAPLGAGGMGEVWLAEDTTLKRKVALKVLLCPGAVPPGGRRWRLRRYLMLTWRSASR
jgi:serine/threonine protein kinase